MKADQLAGIVTCVAGVAGIIATANVDVIAGQNTLSARFFPYLLTIGVTIGGLALALRPEDTAWSEAAGRLLDSRALAFAGLFVLYALTFRYVDFRLGTLAFVAGAMWVMGERRATRLILTPVAVSIVAYLLFRHAFTVMLPTWN